jgi:hypothetical protein
VQTANGQLYVDGQNNRTREDSAGQVIVTLYDQQKEVLVDPSSMACQEYCPLEGDELDASFVNANATSAGTEVIGGVTYNKWQWKDVVFGIIVMETSTAWLDESKSPAVPLKEHVEITPFGQDIGYEDIAWSQLSYGAPDPKLFAVTGVDTCPKSSNCGDDSKQQMRLRHKKLKTWAKYAQK